LTFLSARKVRRFAFHGQYFQAVPFPQALVRRSAERFGVRRIDRLGVDVDVSSLERTLVDSLDRPDLSGGWEEVWRSLESVPYFDLDEVVEYVALLDNATTAARVGFFLEQHQEPLAVDQSYLTRLRALRPKGKHYMDRAAARMNGPRQPGRLVPEWNLVVPLDILQRSWEEPGIAGGLSSLPTAQWSNKDAPEPAELPV
jgi:predicted transcriptional regulator of viral defense system